MITGVHHFALTVSEMERSMAFYRDNFGLEVVSDRQIDRDYVELITGVSGAHVRIVHLRAYGIQLELLQYLDPAGSRRAPALPDAGSAHVCFLSDDLVRDAELLRAAGVPFRSPIVEVTSGPNRGGKGIYVDDPDGNAVEVIELATAPS